MKRRDLQETLMMVSCKGVSSNSFTNDLDEKYFVRRLGCHNKTLQVRRSGINQGSDNFFGYLVSVYVMTMFSFHVVLQRQYPRSPDLRGDRFSSFKTYSQSRCSKQMPKRPKTGSASGPDRRTWIITTDRRRRLQSGERSLWRISSLKCLYSKVIKGQVEFSHGHSTE